MDPTSIVFGSVIGAVVGYLMGALVTYYQCRKQMEVLIEAHRREMTAYFDEKINELRGAIAIGRGTG